MTSYEMVSDLACRLNDPGFSFFREAELRQWVNVAQRDVERRLNGLNADWRLGQSIRAAYGGTDWMTLPTDCREVRMIRCALTLWAAIGTTTYRWPIRFEIEEEGKRGVSDWETSIQWVQVGTRFCIYPIATNTSEGAIVVSYTRRVPDLAAWDDSETSGIQTEYHDLIVRYAEILAKRRIKEDTAQLMQEYQGAFEDIKTSVDVKVVGAGR